MEYREWRSWQRFFKHLRRVDPVLSQNGAKCVILPTQVSLAEAEKIEPFRRGNVYYFRKCMTQLNVARRLLNYFSKERPTTQRPMKKTLKNSARANYSLGDLIMAVSSYTKNNRETVAAVADLLESGRVRLSSHGRKIRARVY